jgi:hypothetical protein
VTPATRQNDATTVTSARERQRFWKEPERPLKQHSVIRPCLDIPPPGTGTASRQHKRAAVTAGSTHQLIDPGRAGIMYPQPPGCMLSPAHVAALAVRRKLADLLPAQPKCSP